jgi:hypothetical protein
MDSTNSDHRIVVDLRPDSRSAGKGELMGLENDSPIITGDVALLDERLFSSGELRVDAVEGAGEGDGFADVVEAADPGYGSLDAHAEAAVGNAAVFAEVEVPLEGS